MCGLFGYRLHDQIVQAPPMWPVFCSAAAVEMERRGTDGWGIAGLRPFEHDIEVLRCETRLTDSLDSHIFGAFHAMILHTRAKTTGEHIVTNNHPFTQGHIIGAHNGVIYNHKELNTKHNRTFAVDSQHIFAHIDEDKPMSELEMYGAIEYYDQRNPTVTYLMRCFHGSLAVASLSYGPSKAPFAIVWASTQTALRDAARLAGFRIEFYKEPENKGLYIAAGDGQLYNTDVKLDVSPKASHVETRSCDYPTGSYGYQGYGSYGGAGFRSHDSYKGDRKSDVAQISLWVTFRDLKPLKNAPEVTKGVLGHATCRGCGVYYSLIAIKGCLFCGRNLDVLSQTWAEKRYLPAEPYLHLMLDNGRFTPPLPKKFVKKHIKLLDELLLTMQDGDAHEELYSALTDAASASDAPATGEEDDATDTDTPPDPYGYLC